MVGLLGVYGNGNEHIHLTTSCVITTVVVVLHASVVQCGPLPALR